MIDGFALDCLYQTKSLKSSATDSAHKLHIINNYNNQYQDDAHQDYCSTLLTVVGAASASSVHSSTSLRGDDEDPISNLRSSLITTNRKLRAPKKKTLKKKKKKKKAGTDEPPFGNANGQDKEMKSCEKPLTLTLQAISELDTDTFYLLSAGALVFFVQAGFAMLMVCQKNVKNVMLKNMLDAISVGYAFAYGGADDGGLGGFFPPADVLGSDSIVAGTVAERSSNPTNLALQLQVLGALILSVGLYGFNPGSTLGAPMDSASFLSDLGDLVAAIQEQPLASVNEIEVEEEEDGSVSVRYGLSLCKEDGSEFDDDEAGLIVAGITDALNEFTQGLAELLGLSGVLWIIGI